MNCSFMCLFNIFRVCGLVRLVLVRGRAERKEEREEKTQEEKGNGSLEVPCRVRGQMRFVREKNENEKSTN